MTISRRQREIVAQKRAGVAASRAPSIALPRSKVYPTKRNSLNIVHPDGTKLKVSGSMFVVDGFTCRMLANSLITLDAASGWNDSPFPNH